MHPVTIEVPTNLGIVTRHVHMPGTWEAVAIAVLAQGALTINSLYTWFIYQLVGRCEVWFGVSGLVGCVGVVCFWVGELVDGRMGRCMHYPQQVVGRMHPPHALVPTKQLSTQNQNQTGLPALECDAPRVEDRAHPGLHLGVRFGRLYTRSSTFFYPCYPNEWDAPCNQNRPHTSIYTRAHTHTQTHSIDTLPFLVYSIYYQVRMRTKRFHVVPDSNPGFTWCVDVFVWFR